MAGPERPVVRPWAYFLTWACYGTKLHGDFPFAVDRDHNAYRGRYAPVNPRLASYERAVRKEPPFELTRALRPLVLASIKGVCSYEGWFLHAAHVRTTHVHVVLTANVDPEKALGKLKSYASRALNAELSGTGKRWARHGSTVWLWDASAVDAAVDYTVREQGQPMSCFEHLDRWQFWTRATEPRP